MGGAAGAARSKRRGWGKTKPGGGYGRIFIYIRIGADLMADRPKVVGGREARAQSFHPRDMVDDTKNPWRELYMPPIGDSKGAMAGRCDITLKEAVGTLISNNDTPWRNESDFVRWSVERGVRDANEILQDPLLADTLAKRAIILRHLQDEMEGQKMLEMAAAIRANIEGMLKDGDIAAAKDEIRLIHDTARSMKSPRWRRKTLEMIAKWKELMKS
jgi:hypothetical protein